MNPSSEDWIVPYHQHGLDVPSLTSLTAGSSFDVKFKSFLIQRFSEKVSSSGESTSVLFEFANQFGPRFLLDLRDYCPRNIDVSKVIDDLPIIEEVKEVNIVQVLIELFLAHTPEQIKRVRETLNGL